MLCTLQLFCVKQKDFYNFFRISIGPTRGALWMHTATCLALRQRDMRDICPTDQNYFWDAYYIILYTYVLYSRNNIEKKPSFMSHWYKTWGILILFKCLAEVWPWDGNQIRDFCQFSHQLLQWKGRAGFLHLRLRNFIIW